MEKMFERATGLTLLYFEKEWKTRVILNLYEKSQKTQTLMKINFLVKIFMPFGRRNIRIKTLIIKKYLSKL